MKPALMLALASTLIAAPLAHAGDAAVEAPIREMIAGFNKGDVKLAKAAHVAAPVITDELAPYSWRGPKAFDAWLGDLTRSEAAEGKTGGQVWLGAPIRESVTGAHAYVLAPSTYTFKQKGRLMRETGTMTFVLVRANAAWKIEAWTWSSPEAKPVR